MIVTVETDLIVRNFVWIVSTFNYHKGRSPEEQLNLIKRYKEVDEDRFIYFSHRGHCGTCCTRCNFRKRCARIFESAMHNDVSTEATREEGPLTVPSRMKNDNEAQCCRLVRTIASLRLMNRNACDSRGRVVKIFSAPVAVSGMTSGRTRIRRIRPRPCARSTYVLCRFFPQLGRRRCISIRPVVMAARAGTIVSRRTSFLARVDVLQRASPSYVATGPDSRMQIAAAPLSSFYFFDFLLPSSPRPTSLGHAAKNEWHF